MPVESLDFSPDGKHARLGELGQDRPPLVGRDRESSRRTSWAHSAWLVRFSPDGKLLATADGLWEVPHYENLPSEIKLWDVDSQREVRTLRGHTNSIRALAFSPDGKILASGSMDQTVKLWDTASGELRETIVPGESGTSAGEGRYNLPLIRSAISHANEPAGINFPKYCRDQGTSCAKVSRPCHPADRRSPVATPAGRPAVQRTEANISGTLTTPPTVVSAGRRDQQAGPAIGTAFAGGFEIQSQRTGDADVLHEARGRIPDRDSSPRGPFADHEIGVGKPAVFLLPSAPTVFADSAVEEELLSGATGENECEGSQVPLRRGFPRAENNQP